MDIKKSDWEDELIAALYTIGAETEYLHYGSYKLVKIKESDHLIINLISLDDNRQPEELLAIQQHWGRSDTQVIQLWEDIWRNRSSQVLSRIASILGKNVTVHGRKTKIIEVNQQIADHFYNQHHLQGTAGCKYRYALVNEGELIAIAGFSDKRKMTLQPGDYTSIELIRFATVTGITVTGGMSKLIKHLVRQVQPNDVMSYADLDWSRGKGYLKLGFQQVSVIPPMQLFLHLPTFERYFPQRLPRNIRTEISVMEHTERDVYLKGLSYVSIYNTGNLKYILYL